MKRTREAIIDAFLMLCRDGNGFGISMPAVAEEADVSVRTVYRYFATKDDLQTAAAYHFNDRVGEVQGRVDVDRSDFESYLRRLWTEFAGDIPAVSAEHATPAGRRMRITRLAGSRDAIRKAVGPDASDQTVDLLVALCSSSMFLELVDRMGHSPAEAVAAVSSAVRLILVAEPGVIS